MDEYVAAVFAFNKAVTFFCIKPFNFACHLTGLLKINTFGARHNFRANATCYYMLSPVNMQGKDEGCS